MNLSHHAEQRLIYLFGKGSLPASERFRWGGSGLWRPIPFPEPYNELATARLVSLEEMRVSDERNKTHQWRWCLTDLGKTTAILLGAKEA